MVRLFYTLLYSATFALGFAWWVQRDGNSFWDDVSVLQQARAQSFNGQPGGVAVPQNPQFGQGFAPPGAMTAPSRPAGWPGGAPTNAVAANVAPVANVPPQGVEQRFDGVERIAQVGNEFILMVDIMSQVNDVLAKNADRIPPNQLEQARQFLLKQRLEQAIETKLVMSDVRRKIPADKMKEIQAKIGETFDEVEVPKAMARGNFTSRAQLEEDMRKLGSSIDRERRAFVERMLAMSWVQQNVKYDEEVTHEQMLAYYQEHAKDYDNAGRVRWQHLQVRFDKHPSKQAAYAVLADAGNKILTGADFGEVAKTVSDGWTANNGGQHEWTTQGSLSSDVLNRVLFTLPVNQMSPILEDDKAFHIVKVLERREAGRTPFTEVQAEIKQKIKQGRSSVAADKYLAKLKSTTQVWTMFDADRPLPTDSPGTIYQALPQVNPLR